jgi:3-methyladenine DNA glycosylase AlkD
MGTAQNRKVYQRHGAGPKLFGVSFADLGKLKKQIGVDRELAVGLWETGNADARILATMIADPDAMTSAELDRWARETSYYVVADSFSGLATRSPLAQKKMEAWTKSKAEFVGQIGWNLLGGLAMYSPDLPDSLFEARLKEIEASIHSAKNRTRHAMNQALICIGMRSRDLHAKAIVAAKRIGKVQVDHGETSCKTPEAIPYMERAWARKKGEKSAAPKRKERGGKKKAKAGAGAA